MTRQFSDAARDRVTEPWEEFVGYVYDDKLPKRHGRYVEWDGGAVRGTLTIGFGHTDAAGGPKIVQGQRITREEAGELLTRDIAPCVAAVNRLLRVEVTQHQFDAVVDTYFNCPAAAVAAIKLINAGQADKVPAKLLQYTYSKGEHMEGLTRRRNAEIAWFTTPDHAEPPPSPNPEVVHSPKAERNPPPKPLHESKQAAAGGSVLAFGLGEAAKALNELLEPLKEAKGSLDELGLVDVIGAAAHDPKVMLCVALAALGAFIIWDRRNKLVNDHA
ncbi:lysozyme [Bradyrhizobium ivorense]|uniref:lysozyme n=1 Tax=Bradyrhizobium ivorense TaxID=2511166 RepID=UPI0010B0A7C8|nr:lysozyme [Bradyrhizobium ivorense]VIO73908.1 Lysozyme RrrD [Bradyrhizobium ivorense]